MAIPLPVEVIIDHHALDRNQKRIAINVLTDRLNRGADLTAEWATLSQSERRQVQQKVIYLAQVWLHDRADEYQRLRFESRRRYLDRQIDQLLTWVRQSSPIDGNRGDLMQGLDLFQMRMELEDWIGNLTPQQRQEYEQFWYALQDRLSKRRMR